MKFKRNKKLNTDYRLPNTRTGFTLIELLVAISIIALLSSIVLVTISGARVKAKDAKVNQEIDGIKTALEAYNTEHGGYPNPGDGLFCIGGTDCILAGSSVGTKFPENISFVPNKSSLASIFPSFSSGSLSLDDNNKGYIYLSCGGSEATCAKDSAYLIYPRFSDNSMVSMKIGTFSSETCDLGSCNNNSQTDFSESAYPYCSSDGSSTGYTYDNAGSGWCSANGNNYYGTSLPSNLPYLSGTGNCVNITISSSYGAGSSGSYCDTDSYRDQGTYGYCFSGDTGEGCSYGDGWCGNFYYYCQTTQYTQCNYGSGNSVYGNGPNGWCSYYSPSQNTYYDQGTYPFCFSYDVGNGTCSYGDGWCGGSYYYCTSDDTNSYNSYYDNQNSCNQYSVSAIDYNNNTSRYYTDYNECQNSLITYNYYYDSSSGCNYVQVSSSDYNNNPSIYYNDYNSCIMSQYSYYYDNQNSCYSSFISPSDYNNYPSRYFSDYNSCINSIDTYSYYYDSSDSCNYINISSSQYNSDPSRYFSDYGSCESYITSPPYYDSGSYPYCYPYDSGGSCTYGNGWCGDSQYYCQYY